ncbi:SBK1 kinase, partial [Amia calva]|nr:SBK1 kinase [Amia calva]
MLGYIVKSVELRTRAVMFRLYNAVVRAHLERLRVGIPESSVKRCAEQVASALEFIHGRGLVHRDIKPENILLLDRQCQRVKLADFGLAQKRGAVIRLISGTLPYMAPELCAVAGGDGGSEGPRAGVPLRVEPSLDTWAFGVVLFCILTGYFPWERCTPLDDFFQEFAEWSGGRGGEVPSQWKRFSPPALAMFRRLLAPDPWERCRVGEVRSYMDQAWVRAADGRGKGQKEEDSGELRANPTLSVRRSSSLVPPEEE